MFTKTCDRTNRRKMLSQYFCGLVLVVVLCQGTHAQVLKFAPSGNGVVEQTQSKDDLTEQKQTPSEPLTLLWGIGDSTAYFGKLFVYTLPSDAFQGNVVKYDVTEVGKDHLPDWLVFNALKAELRGIPGPQDKGQVYLKVIAIGDDNSKADDVFSIEVIDETYGSIGSTKQVDENGPKHVLCKRDETQTTVTVIVDCDLDLMKASDKIKLVDNLVGHLNLAPEMIQLMPVGNKPMYDSNVFLTGPGNTKLPKFVGSLLSWTVGCGKVETDHLPVIELVEKSAKDATMSAALGNDIIGWHVSNNAFQKKLRKRRQAVTATPTMNIAPPTKVSDTMESSEVIKPTASVTMISTATVEVKPMGVDNKPMGVDNKPIGVDDKPTDTDTSTSISPSQTIEMTQTMDATAELPSQTFTMTSTQVMTATEVMPTSTVQTTASATTTTPTTTETTTEPTTAPPTEKPVVVTPEPMCPPGKLSDKKPYILNPLKDYTLVAGEIRKLKIPQNTFYDCLDGDTSDLSLTITKPNGLKLPSDFWLQLHQRTLRPYQILVNPLAADVGRYDFLLTAGNFNNKKNSLKFNVVVKEGNKAEFLPNHELSMTIDTDYDTFMSNVNNRLDLSNKIAGVFGDRNSNSMSVTRLERGSVIYAWTNNSLAGDSCNVQAIGSVFDKIVTEDGQITPEAKMKLDPYKLTSVVTAPLGSCENNPNFPVRAAGVITPTTLAPSTVKPSTKTPMEKTTAQVTIKYDEGEDDSVEKTTKMPESTTLKVAAAGAGGGGGSDIWITTVVPAIVVVIVLIIALIIACCLYRKKRKGKMKLGEKNSYGTGKGVPVIFADELDEKPNDSTRPLIMDEERPPMPPPEYQRASSETSGNSNSTQLVGDKDIEEIEMEDTDITSPLYSPPPPVTASNNSKPHHVHSARGPPPYVPP